MTLKDKTILITGSSRGIGEAMAYRFAKEGANIVVLAKTAEPNPKLPGTIYTVAKEVERLGGKALPIKADIRFEEEVLAVVDKAVDTFGGLDILINNASAIFPFPTLQTPMKRFDLMFSCNVRGAFLCSQACLPHLLKGENPHILNMSPPLNMEAKWFKDHLAYTMSKYGMSMCTLGMSKEFEREGVAVNSLWPKTTIATAAIGTFFPEVMERSRHPSIVAEAAYAIVTKNSKTTSGNFFIDEEVLSNEGITDFTQFAVNVEEALQADLYID